MNKKNLVVVLLQTILIVILFWMLVFYGKDEYEAFQKELEEEIETPNRVSEKDGISSVTLSPATQKNSGIKTDVVLPINFEGEIKSYGSVVNIDGLIDAKAQYLSLTSALSLNNASQTQNQAQYERLKALNTDDKNVSDRAVQEAQALANADIAKRNATYQQIKQLKESTQIKWGEALAQLVFSNNAPAHLQALLTRNNVLIQVSLPLNTAAPKIGSRIQITPLNASSQMIKAHYVSPATLSDQSGFGKTYYYTAAADILRIGMRVNAEIDPNANDAKQGVVIPNSAVVWYAGKAWAYFKEDDDHFIRKPIETDTEIEEGWFNQAISADSIVVTSGAQLLLSEEFKYQIKNENED
ncbi:MAG: efflux RND transporter periplasmic adaptor subunit [Methylotenera sp.]|nr:efflux RND transporter periplasmic adaptor subunit [Methylotenera sp.]